MPADYLITAGVLFLAGLLLGRVLNRCISRLPEEFHVGPAWKKVFSVESRLGQYPKTRWYYWLPVIGTASIVGRSPYSGRRILAREPWLELLNGLLVVITFYCMFPPELWGEVSASYISKNHVPGYIYQWQELSPVYLWGRFFYFLFLVETLFVATFIDFDLWIIPDGCTVPAMVVGFFGQLLGIGFFFAPFWFQDQSMVNFSIQLIPQLGFWPVTGQLPEWIAKFPLAHAAAVSSVGFLVGGGIVWSIRIIGQLVLKREAMGFGDVILMAMIGSFIGWQPVVVVFFLAPLMALVVIAVITVIKSLSLSKIPLELPYGPYLSLATLVVIFCWDMIWASVGRLFAMGPILILFSLLMLVFMVLALLLVQGVKLLLGIAAWEEFGESWRAADQHHFFHGESARSAAGSMAEKELGWNQCQPWEIMRTALAWNVSVILKADRTCNRKINYNDTHHRLRHGQSSLSGKSTGTHRRRRKNLYDSI